MFLNGGLRPLLLLAFFALAFPGAAFSQARDKPVAIGDTAPDFTLTDQNGRRHSLSAERGKRPVVLIFYRGHW